MDFVDEIESDRAALEASLVSVETRLVQVRAQLDADGLAVEGSRGQVRPHPLVASERALIRDSERLRRALDALRIRARQEDDRRRVDEQIRAANEIAGWGSTRGATATREC